MTSLYIAHTPYHVILASALASESDESQGDQHLLGILDSDMEPLLESIRGARDDPFDEVRTLAGAATFASRIAHTSRLTQFRARYNCFVVRRYVADNRTNEVYSFNDQRPEDQAAFDAVTRDESLRDVRRVYVEDGTSAYTYMRREWSWFETVKMKLFYGRWRTQVEEHGSSKWVDEVYGSFPDHVRPDLRTRPVSALPREAVLALGDRSWFRRYLETCDVADRLDELDGVVFVALSEDVDFDGEYVETIESVIRRFTDRGDRIGVKYHPRESKEFLNLDGSSAVVLPRGIPAEVIFVANPDGIGFVLGNVSTSLLTARWLCEDVTVISLARVFQSDFEHLLGVFESLGIRVTDTLSEVAAPPR